MALEYPGKTLTFPSSLSLQLKWELHDQRVRFPSKDGIYADSVECEKKNADVIRAICVALVKEMGIEEAEGVFIACPLSVFSSL